MLRFFYSFTASDGSERSTAGRVVSPCSIMMHHGIRSKEARRARKQRYQLRQTTSHYSLLVARQGDVSRKLNQAFLLVDSFNFNFVDEERSDIYIASSLADEGCQLGDVWRQRNSSGIGSKHTLAVLLLFSLSRRIRHRMPPKGSAQPLHCRFQFRCPNPSLPFAVGQYRCFARLKAPCSIDSTPS